MSISTAQDEARRALEIRIATSLDISSQHEVGRAKLWLTDVEMGIVLDALRAEPARGAEEGRDILQGLDPRFTFDQHVAFFRKIAEHWTGPTRDGYLNYADKIEAAVRALPASHEGGGE